MRLLAACDTVVCARGRQLLRCAWNMRRVQAAGGAPRSVHERRLWWCAAPDQAELLADKRIVVALDAWDTDSAYPSGHYVRALGAIGDRRALRRAPACIARISPGHGTWGSFPGALERQGPGLAL